MKLKNKNYGINARFKTYIVNTSWLFAERILRMSVALFVSIYLARYLGPERFGLLSYAISFVSLFTALAALGLDGIVVRELVKSPECKEDLLGTAFGLKVSGAVLMWLVTLIAVFIIESNTQTNTLIAIIGFAVIFQAFNVIDFNYQAEIKSKYVAQVQLIQLIVSSVTKLLLIAIEAPLTWFAWVYCLDAMVLASGLVAMYLYKTGDIWVWRWRWKIARRVLKESWVLLLYAYFVAINMNIDTVMIKHIVGVESAGFYSVARTLSSAWYFFPIIIGSTFFPYIVNRKSEVNYKSKVGSLFGFLSLVAIFGAVVVSHLGYWIINLLYGYEYIEAAKILTIHIWTGVFVFHVSIRSRLFISDNMPHFSMIFMCFGVIFNVIGNYLLIPLYGGVGAAYASLISWGANVVFFPLFNRNSRYFVYLFFISPINICLKKWDMNDACQK